MVLQDQLSKQIAVAISTLYDGMETSINLQLTREEFAGEYTFVVFPLVKLLKANPIAIGENIGNYLKENSSIVKDFNVVKGFLNISLESSLWKGQMLDIVNDKDYGQHSPIDRTALVEFSSPNTNKPLHLGHIRNILLGWSVAQIKEKAGYKVVKTQIINDRGIAICKSMVAWLNYGDNATPSSTGIKGDLFIGGYYVQFESSFKAEYKTWQAEAVGQDTYKEEAKEKESEEAFYKRYKNQYFNQYSELGKQAKDMLLKWEAGDKETIDLWKKMNGWVYEGFDVTYKALGVNFDSLYYESDTYLLGKDHVSKGLESEVFYRKEDGSTWIDLENAGLDHKIVLRSDGTSVYITQDIGTAMKRYEDTGAKEMIYVVADEQDYHFKVLKAIMQALEAPFADNIHHLSYGMVELPTGKMKSREGTVVDADDLMADVITEAKEGAVERGELTDVSEEERQQMYEQIGMSALKYFILKINPKKRIIFDPTESLDMQGQTGPYIQNAYVRIQSILRKWDDQSTAVASKYTDLLDTEVKMIRLLSEYTNLISQAAKENDPSMIANYCYTLAKDYHRYYHDVRILSADTEEAKAFRIVFCQAVANVIKSAMHLLGIDMPQRM